MAFTPWIILSFAALGIVLTSIPYIHQMLDSASFHHFLFSDNALFVGGILIIALGNYAIHRIFQRGDSRHRKEYSRTRLIVGTVGNEDDPKSQSRDAWWNNPLPILPNSYFAVFRKPDTIRLLTPIKRVLLVLGAGFHGRGVAVSIVFNMILVIIGATIFHFRLFNVLENTLTIAKWGLAANCVLPIFQYVQLIINSIYRTRVEQALIRLTPASPAMQEFNKALYPAMLKRFLLAWGVLSVCGVISFMLLDGSFTDIPTLISLCTVYLLLAPCLVQNYAKMGPPESSSMMAGSLISMHVIILLFVCLQYLVPPLPWPMLALFSISTSIALVILRLRKMRQAAVAFPAGRFA